MMLEKNQNKGDKKKKKIRTTEQLSLPLPCGDHVGYPFDKNQDKGVFSCIPHES
jgi:hypothetical protein